MSSGITAGLDAGYEFQANTWVAHEDRRDQKQEISPTGEGTPVPGFNKEKALAFTRKLCWRLEYTWQEDPSNDPFV